MKRLSILFSLFMGLALSPPLVGCSRLYG
jgi:hypothetical protein